MDTTLLDTKFSRMGARLKVAQPPRRFGTDPPAVSLDVRSDHRGEFFEVALRPAADAELAVLDLRPDDRHLLLLVREAGAKAKFLCGHDERHWFVAGIPESASVGTVRQAKEALKPFEVRAAQAGVGLRGRAAERRKNAAFVRQGEWFFIPEPDLVVDPKLVLANEPISRGRGKPHRLDQCYRTGGETVYVCPRHPTGVSEAEYRHLLSAVKSAKGWGWRTMRRNAGVYARGRVRHADHATIILRCWHRVLMNTEGQSRAMRNVAFLD